MKTTKLFAAAAALVACLLTARTAAAKMTKEEDNAAMKVLGEILHHTDASSTQAWWHKLVLGQEPTAEEWEKARKGGQEVRATPTHDLAHLLKKVADAKWANCGEHAEVAAVGLEKSKHFKKVYVGSLKHSGSGSPTQTIEGKQWAKCDHVFAIVEQHDGNYALVDSWVQLLNSDIPAAQLEKAKTESLVHLWFFQGGHFDAKKAYPFLHPECRLQLREINADKAAFDAFAAHFEK